MHVAVQQFIDTLSKQRNSSNNTVGAYKTDLTQLITFLREAEVANWEQVTPADIAAFVENLRQQNYAATSVARKIAALKSFFHFLSENGVATIELTGGFDAPKLEKQLPSVLLPEDM